MAGSSVGSPDALRDVVSRPIFVSSLVSKLSSRDISIIYEKKDSCYFLEPRNPVRAIYIPAFEPYRMAIAPNLRIFSIHFTRPNSYEPVDV